MRKRAPARLASAPRAPAVAANPDGASPRLSGAGQRDAPASLRIAVDCMGGDHAPAETVAGAITAAQAFDLHVLLCGVPEPLRPFIPADVTEAPDGARTVEIVPSGPAVPEGAPPLASLRALPNASMTIAMRQVREGRADAAVSAASTGPTLLAAVRELGMLEGVRRACVGRSIIGLHPKTFLIDLGPTMDCEAQHLLEFAVIGTTYMRVFEGIREPTVALLSNGREPGKGNRVVKQAAQLLARSGLNYAGLVEGHHFVAGEANVVVCDGFTGNAVLKSIEGLGREIAGWLKAELARDVPAKRLDAVASRLIELTNPIDLHGSLPLLGVRGNVVMAHGASDRHAIQAAIGQAVQAVRVRFVDTLRAALAETRARLTTTTPAV